MTPLGVWVIGCTQVGVAGVGKRVLGVSAHFQGYVGHFGLASFHPMVYLLTAFFYNLLALFRGQVFLSGIFFQFSSIFYKFLFSPAMISSFFNLFTFQFHEFLKKAVREFEYSRFQDTEIRALVSSSVPTQIFGLSQVLHSRVEIFVKSH